MPNFGLDLPHPLDKYSAIQRLQAFSTSLQGQHRDRVQDVEQRWEDNQLIFSFSTAGLAISGRVIVEDQRAVVQGQLPFAALIFRGRLEQEIRTKLSELLR